MRSIRWSTSFVLATVLSSGCLDRPIEPIDSRTTSVVSERIPPAPTRIDLLIAIDNSGSMADKQRILADAVPQLVERLVNPRCVTADGRVIAPPESPTEKCPAGSRREFTPIEDVNIGVISSSLGDLDAGDCPNERAHLSGRAKDADGVAYDIPAYANQSFLAWDPRSKRAGQASLPELRTSVADLVRGMGQQGCGYEMQLESVVRFLVDPAPYLSVERIENPQAPSYQIGQPRGVDEEILVQRRDFLRPDSLVAIVMLSDENDCSMMPQGVGGNVLETDETFLRARSICATQPNDPCCSSCGAQPAECPEDPVCAPGASALTKEEDKSTLRCWNQKRRYGIDFLYPTARYVNAFTAQQIDPTAPDFAPTNADKAVDNPLFANLTGEAVPRRTSSFVFFAGIVGVPWQAITRKNTDGAADIALGYMTPREIEAAGLFDALVGDPSKYVSPTDPFMIESDAPREGTSAILGVAPSVENTINGFDRERSSLGDLEYACIFDLPAPHLTGTADCAGSPDSPLCDGDTQIRAKAYPGIRQLSVIRGLGQQGVAASVCPASLEDPSSESYGYNPAVGSIVEALRGRLDQQCLPRGLHPDENQQVSCLVVEARYAEDTCNCDGKARQPIDASHENVVAAIRKDPASDDRWNCFCEVAQVTDAAGQALCQNADEVALEQEDVHGFCYIDATAIPKIGNEKLVERCPEGEKRAIRFVNEGRTPRGASAMVICADQTGD